MIKFGYAEKNKMATCTLHNRYDYAAGFTGILDKQILRYY